MNSNRLARLSAILHERRIDHALLTSHASLRYFTGFTAPLETGPSPFAPLPAALLTINEERPALFFADTESLDYIVPEVSCEGFVSYTFEDPPHPMMALAQKVIEHLKPLPKGVVGIEGDYLPHSLLEGIRHECAPLKFQDVTQAVAELRMIKSQDEIHAIKDAVALCDLGQQQARKLAKPGMTELELFEEVRKAMETKAERRIPLLCDFISGPRTAQVGGPPSSRILSQGDLLLVDLAPQYNGYWGDSCNTLAIGEPTRDQEKLFTSVSNALADASELVRPGIRACDVDALLRQRMGKLGGSYPHHSGHGLGVTYHEEPRIVPYNRAPLQENMIIALEPGVYFTDRWGLRLEYVLLVSATGMQLLSGFRHTLV